jgi:two-component system, sensor histidine kinase PdtaS
MMRVLSSVLILVAVFNAQAQHSIRIDSLNRLLQNDLEISKKAFVLDELSYEWFSQNLDSSLHYGKAAYKLFSDLSDPKGLSQAVTSVAVAFHYLNQWDSAKFYYEKALDIRVIDKDSTKMASSLNNLGVMYMDKEEYDKATNYYVQAMKVREMSNDSMGVAITKLNLGLIFKKQGNFEKAIDYYKEAITGFKKYKRDNYLEGALLNLGAIYNTIGKYDLGLMYNLELRKLAEKRSSERNLSKSYVNLANSYQGLGYLDSSLYYVTKALTFFEEKKDTINMAHSLLSISQFYMDKGDYQNAINYSLKLKRINQTLKNREVSIENQLVLAKAFAANNDYEKAYESLQNSYYQKDSFLTESLNETISKLTFKYESEQKEREISELKIENQEVIIANQQAANQRNILLLVAGIFIVSALLLYLLLRTKSRANIVISKSLDEKETLLKEIHHRVKNNLQVISSLLSLQSRYIEDKDAKALVNEGQNRVKSMALIHQKLYQHNNLTGVEALDYVQNLTATLRSAYGIDPYRVNVKYDIDKMNVDVDTIIPIGLILNELISNSFKYAFPDERKGELNIRFKEKGDKLQLVVKDNGVGSSTEINKADSFGMRMIQSLSRKLEAEINFDFSDGIEASLIISHYKLV